MAFQVDHRFKISHPNNSNNYTRFLQSKSPFPFHGNSCLPLNQRTLLLLSALLVLNKKENANYSEVLHSIKVAENLNLYYHPVWNHTCINTGVLTGSKPHHLQGLIYPFPLASGKTYLLFFFPYMLPSSASILKYLICITFLKVQ